MKLFEIHDQRRVLKTQKGSSIKRSRYGVGKLIGGYLYVHRTYVKDLPEELQNKVAEAEKHSDNFTHNIVKIGIGTPIVSLINSPDFDQSDEPVVGDYLVVNLDTGGVKRGNSRSIWHHKWLWVKDNYRGFDVDQSFNRSKEYLKMNIDFSKIGNKDFWDKNYAKKIK